MAARTDRRVTYSFWLLLGEMVCPEGKRPCAGVSPLTPPVLPDRCRVCRARSLLKGLSSGLADPDRQVPRSSLRAPSPSVKQRRSEEHTSELQSLTNLVCRLLLAKKTSSS